MPSYQENKSLRNQGRGEVTYHADAAPPFDKWFLIEWEFNDDPAAITMWVDGEKITTTVNGAKLETVTFEWPKDSGKKSDLVGGYKEFGFGTRVWGKPMQTFDVYYDDIAIGTSRIGK